MSADLSDDDQDDQDDNYSEIFEGSGDELSYGEDDRNGEDYENDYDLLVERSAEAKRVAVSIPRNPRKGDSSGDMARLKGRGLTEQEHPVSESSPDRKGPVKKIVGRDEGSQAKDRQGEGSNAQRTNSTKNNPARRKKILNKRKQSDGQGRKEQAPQLPKLTQEELDLENELNVDALLKSHCLYNENARPDQKVERRTKDGAAGRKAETKPSRSSGTVQATSGHRQEDVDDRVAVLKAREKALLEAIEELSSQNEELIMKLDVSMRNELELERRLLMLCTGVSESQLLRSFSEPSPVRGKGGGSNGTTGRSFSSSERDDDSQVNAGGRRSVVRARLGEALNKGRRSRTGTEQKRVS